MAGDDDETRATRRAASIKEILSGCTTTEIFDALDHLPDTYKVELRGWAWRRHKFGNAAVANEFVGDIDRFLGEVVQKPALGSNCFLVRERFFARLARG